MWALLCIDYVLWPQSCACFCISFLLIVNLNSCSYRFNEFSSNFAQKCGIFPVECPLSKAVNYAQNFAGRIYPNLPSHLEYQITGFDHTKSWHHFNVIFPYFKMALLGIILAANSLRTAGRGDLEDPAFNTILPQVCHANNVPLPCGAWLCQLGYFCITFHVVPEIDACHFTSEGLLLPEPPAHWILVLSKYQ